MTIDLTTKKNFFTIQVTGFRGKEITGSRCDSKKRHIGDWRTSHVLRELLHFRVTSGHRLNDSIISESSERLSLVPTDDGSSCSFCFLFLCSTAATCSSRANVRMLYFMNNCTPIFAQSWRRTVFHVSSRAPNSEEDAPIGNTHACYAWP